MNVTGTMQLCVYVELNTCVVVRMFVSIIKPRAALQHAGTVVPARPVTLLNCKLHWKLHWILQCSSSRNVPSLVFHQWRECWKSKLATFDSLVLSWHLGILVGLILLFTMSFLLVCFTQYKQDSVTKVLLLYLFVSIECSHYHLLESTLPMMNEILYGLHYSCTLYVQLGLWPGPAEPTSKISVEFVIYTKYMVYWRACLNVRRCSIFIDN